MPSSSARCAVTDVAFEHELERGLRADQPRQALRAARARQQAEFDLRQSQLRTRRRDAIVAGERELEAAAKHVPSIAAT